MDSALLFTIPKQSVRLSSRALGFALQRNRFALGGPEETQTLEQNQKQNQNTLLPFEETSELTSGLPWYVRW